MSKNWRQNSPKLTMCRVDPNDDLRDPACYRTCATWFQFHPKTITAVQPAIQPSIQQ